MIYGAPFPHIFQILGKNSPFYAYKSILAKIAKLPAKIFSYLHTGSSCSFQQKIAKNKGHLDLFSAIYPGTPITFSQNKNKAAAFPFWSVFGWFCVLFAQIGSIRPLFLAIFPQKLHITLS